MIAVGIDVSKSKSTVAILDSYGTVLATPFNMAHTQPAIVAHRRLQRPHDILVCTGIAYIGVQFRKFHKATSSLFPYYNKLRPFSRCR